MNLALPVELACHQQVRALLECYEVPYERIGHTLFGLDY
jgi:hypothetical protein